MPSFNFLSSHFIAALLALIPLLVSAHEIEVVMGSEHWKYREFGFLNNELDREQGWLSHIEFNSLLEVTRQHKIHTRINAQHGTLDYIGQTQGGNALRTRTKESTKGSAISWRYYFTHAYLGLGVTQQMWDRKIQASAHSSKLDEYYRWWGPQLELGSFYTRNQLTVGFASSVSVLNGNMMVDLTEVIYKDKTLNFGKPKIPLNDAYEINAQLQIKYEFVRNWFLLLNHYQGLRHFPESDYVTVHSGIFLNEPKSKNYYYGVNAGVGIKF